MKRFKRLAEAIGSDLMKDGLEQVEVYLQDRRKIGIEILGSEIRDISLNNDQGLGIRAFKDRASGFVSQMGTDLRSLKYLLQGLSSTIAHSDKDPDFKSLPSLDTSEYKDISQDKRLKHLTPDDLVGITKALIDEAKAVDADVSLRGEVVVLINTSCVWNSLGVDVTRQMSIMGVDLSAAVKRGDDVGTYSDFVQGRRLKDIKYEGLGTEVTKKALKYLKARRIKTGVYPVIASPETSFSFLSSIAASLNAESLQRDRSPFVGRFDEDLAVPFLKIFDDPMINRALRSASYDSEGVPCKKLTLIEGGRLKDMLHNSYTAGKIGVQSNGRGFRMGYGMRPDIGSTNLIVERQDKREKALIKEIKQGIYLTSGYLFPNTNGDISCTVDLGYWIENGRLAYPIKNAMLGTTIFHLLKNLVAISSDGKKLPGGIIIPSMLFDGIMVSGE